LADRIRALREEGVLTFIAAGNSGYRDGVGSPGCISSAVTVGATLRPVGGNYAMAGFSNSAEDRLIDLIAIGDNIRSSVPGNKFALMSGTSMATPVGAGAFAVLRAAYPNASVDEIERAMKAAGVKSKVFNSEAQLPAVDLAAAYELMANGNAGGAFARSPPGAIPPASSAPLTPQPQVAQSPQSGTRFIVETPSGTAGRSAMAVVQSSVELASKLNLKAGGVKASPISGDVLTVTTEERVDVNDMRNALRDVIGVHQVIVDAPVRAAPR
jgi:subtilisin family serine protease